MAWPLGVASVRSLATVGFGIAFAVASSDVIALTLDEVKIDPNSISAKCAPIDGEHAISMQARSLYATIEGAPAILFLPPTAKSFHSFECGGAKSTIYYYQYPTLKDAKGALGYAQGMIWGGKSPSADHPEHVFLVENVLVVVSSRDPKIFKAHLSKSAS